MISTVKIKEHVQLYKRFGVPNAFEGKICYISNTSDFTNITVAEKDLSAVRIFYSGRATPEKRPHLVAAIAKKVHQKDSSIAFIMAGDEFGALRQPELSFISFKGNITDNKVLQSTYITCNVLLITSATEGFPLAVIEGMAYGCAIIATPVGDIPVHVKTNQNGFLFSTVDDEKIVVEEGVNFILALKANRALHKTICANNIAYAQHNFALQKFGEAYNKLIYS
jgi:L-malate glycosyltransferase